MKSVLACHSDMSLEHEGLPASNFYYEVNMQTTTISTPTVTLDARNPLHEIAGQMALRKHFRGDKSGLSLDEIVEMACSDLVRYGEKFAQAVSLYAESRSERYFRFPSAGPTLHLISLDKDGHIIKVNDALLGKMIELEGKPKEAIVGCSGYEVLSGPRTGQLVTGPDVVRDIPLIPKYRPGVISDWVHSQTNHGSNVDLSAASFSPRVSMMPDRVVTLEKNRFGETLFALYLGSESRGLFEQLARTKEVNFADLMKMAPSDMDNLVLLERKRYEREIQRQEPVAAKQQKLCSVLTVLKEHDGVRELQLGKRPVTLSGKLCDTLSAEDVVMRARALGGVWERDGSQGIRARKNGKEEEIMGSSLVRDPSADGVLLVYDETRLDEISRDYVKPKQGYTLRDALLGCIVIGGEPAKLANLVVGGQPPMLF